MADLIANALAACQRTEPEIEAWVEVQPQPALEDGPLRGVPFGVKDIIETAGLATEYGSELYRGRKGEYDAPVVSALRRAGGVLFGKTRTTAFAYLDAGPTRNPRNPAHTPGGSSSGSAAAVAAGVVPFALGTQTMGSIIRPASFCGITGFKPTFGTLSTEGVLTFAASLDTVGVLAESAAMCSRVWSSLGYRDDEPAGAPRFAVPSGLPSVSAEMQSAFEKAVARLAPVGMIELPRTYGDLLQAARVINSYEGARSQFARWKQFGDRIGVKLSALVFEGMRITDSQHQDAVQLLKEYDGWFDDAPFLLTPAAPGAAPESLESTGDSIMNAVWTALGLPAVTVPIPVAGGMPLGLQIIGPRRSDASLLRVAAAVEKALAR